jgi:uncharacterized membrane protein
MSSSFRSLLKSCTWRVFATMDTFLLSWLITGHVMIAAAIGGFEIITKLVIYFVHERLWAHIRYGKGGK